MAYLLHFIRGAKTFFREGAAMANRILVVDDERDVLGVIEKMLVGHGYDVTLSTSGDEALELLQRQAFDLVFLDVMMPDMDGFEVCRRIREMESLKELPVVFLTAKGGGEALGEGLDVGGTLYISKPFTGDKLRAILHALLDSAS
jgi:CheY-like chemotaxis protein